MNKLLMKLDVKVHGPVTERIQKIEKKYRTSSDKSQCLKNLIFRAVSGDKVAKAWICAGELREIPMHGFVFHVPDEKYVLYAYVHETYMSSIRYCQRAPMAITLGKMYSII